MDYQDILSISLSLLQSLAIGKTDYVLAIFNNYPAKSRGISPAKIRRYSARLSSMIVLLFNKLITKLTILSNQEKNSFIYSLACCGVQNYVYCRISVTYGWQILRESWPYLDSVTICWIISLNINIWNENAHYSYNVLVTFCNFPSERFFQVTT